MVTRSPRHIRSRGMLRRISLNRATDRLKMVPSRRRTRSKITHNNRRIRNKDMLSRKPILSKATHSLKRDSPSM